MSISIFAFWLLLCGRLDWDVVFVGVVLTALVAAFGYRFLGLTYKSELRLLRLLPLLIAYLAVMLWEVFLANLTMAQVLLRRELLMLPTLVTFETSFRSDWARAVLAESITLTPGTIAVTVAGNVFRVHCVSLYMGEDILTSRYMRLLRRMDAIGPIREKRAKQPAP